VRVADRHDELADPQPGRVAELGGRQARGRGAQDGEVRQRVAAHEARLHVAAVGERGGDAAGAADDVGGGEHEAVGRDDDARAAAAAHPQVGQ
jgi:hypothetical protein